MNSFVVLLAKSDAHDPIALAKALAVVRKTPLQDQLVSAKACWGIVAENLTEADARSLAEGLRREGQETIVQPATLLKVLPEAIKAPTLELLMSSPPLLIAAAGFNVTSTTTKLIKEGPSVAQKLASTAILLGTGIPIKIGGKSRTVEKTEHQSEQVFYADLIYKDPWRRLRVNAQTFNYACLKERKLYYVLGNFKLLLGDLVAFASKAWTNHGTRILLENKPVQLMGYQSLSDLEKESRWLLALQSLKN